MLIVSGLLLLLLQTVVKASAGGKQDNPRHDRPPVGKLAVDDRVNWNEKAREELQRALQYRPRLRRAKNIILFVGDGMGITTQTAARIFRTQRLTGGKFSDSKLSWEDFPISGLSKTYSVDYQTPGSAEATTAILCGEKTLKDMIGMSQEATVGDCSTVAGNELKSILHHAVEDGKRTGIVTTTRVTDGTPAAAYAHSVHRQWECDADLPGEAVGACLDIARQLVEGDINPNIRVILGGGRRKFFPTHMPDPEYPSFRGERTDGLNLVQNWADNKASKGLSHDEYKYVEKLEDFENINTNQVEYLLGLFERDHMKYEADRLRENNTDAWQEPSLAQMVDTAIDILNKGEDGYFLLVEGGRVDHGHHMTNAWRALHDTVALSDAVQRADDMTNDDDTLIVVTADHSIAFTISGSTGVDSDILGLVREYGAKENTMASDDKPYSALSYANGPGYLVHRTAHGSLHKETPRHNLSGIFSEEGVDSLQDAAVPLPGATHGGEDVAVYAKGPMDHLHSGLHEQHYIAHALMYAACLGPRQRCAGT